MSGALTPHPLPQAAGARSRRHEQANPCSEPLRIIGPSQRPHVSLPPRRCLGQRGAEVMSAADLVDFLRSARTLSQRSCGTMRRSGTSPWTMSAGSPLRAVRMPVLGSFARNGAHPSFEAVLKIARGLGIRMRLAAKNDVRTGKGCG